MNDIFFHYMDWVIYLMPRYFRRKTKTGRVCALIGLPVVYPLYMLLFLFGAVVALIGAAVYYIKGAAQ